MPERIGGETHRHVEPVAPVARPRPLGGEEPRHPSPDTTKKDTPEAEPPPDELTDDPKHTISTRR